MSPYSTLLEGHAENYDNSENFALYAVEGVADHNLWPLRREFIIAF
jgi:hypothetical protein